MQVNFTINIDDKLIGRMKKFLTKRNTIAVIFVCVIGVSAMLYAGDFKEKWTFSTGEIIDADKINENFRDLFDAVDKLKTSNIALFEPGMIMPYARPTPPSGWLLCDGSPIPPSYTTLIGLIGSNTPDLRGRYIIGKMTEAAPSGDHRFGLYGDLDENNVPWTRTERKVSPNFYTWKHTLIAEEVPRHVHEFSDFRFDLDTILYERASGGSPTGSVKYVTATGTSSTNVLNNEEATGRQTLEWGGQSATVPVVPFSILPPSMVMNYIIKY